MEIWMIKWVNQNTDKSMAKKRKQLQRTCISFASQFFHFSFSISRLTGHSKLKRVFFKKKIKINKLLDLKFFWRHLPWNSNHNLIILLSKKKNPFFKKVLTMIFFVLLSFHVSLSLGACTANLVRFFFFSDFRKILIHSFLLRMELDGMHFNMWSRSCFLYRCVFFEKNFDFWILFLSAQLVSDFCKTTAVCAGQTTGNISFFFFCLLSIDFFVA